MAALHLTRDATAPPTVLWDVVTDFAAYERWMPVTTMRLDEGTRRPGWGFAARSGVGPVGFTDSMLVTAWDPPSDGRSGHFRVVKTGALLGGRVDVRVEARGTGSRLVWDQDLVVRPLPLKSLTDPVVTLTGQLLYGRALDAIVAEADRVAAQGRRR